MDKKEVLQFEEDDTSLVGMNGKQVFFTKRINGKTTHNKLEDEDSMTLYKMEKKRQEDRKDELFIEFKNPQYQNKDNIKKDNTTSKNHKKKSRVDSRKNRRKAKKQKKTIKIILWIFLIAGISVFIMISPIFNIKEIEVNGNNKISSETIISLSDIHKEKNIFQINKRNIIKNIKENTYIDDVTIKRKMPGTIRIDVKEREISYQVKAINSYVYIDYQGYILEVNSKGGKVPLIEGLSTDQDTLLNGKRLLNSDLQYLNAMLKIMDAAKSVEVDKKISKIKIKDNEYILELKKEEKEAYLGNATNLTNKIMYVKAILEKEKGNKGKIFVDGDINNGFKPYFREDVKS